MPNTGNCNQGMLIHRIHLFVQLLVGLRNRLIESLTARLRPVNQKKCVIQCAPKFISNRVILVELHNRLKHHRAQIIQIICSLVKPCQIRSLEFMLLLGGHTAALQPRPKTECQGNLFTIHCLREENLFMIFVHSLVRLSVQITHSLETTAFIFTYISEIENTYCTASLPFSGNLYLTRQPKVAVAPKPMCTCFYTVPCLIGRWDRRIDRRRVRISYLELRQCYNVTVTECCDFLNPFF